MSGIRRVLYRAPSAASIQGSADKPKRSRKRAFNSFCCETILEKNITDSTANQTRQLCYRKDDRAMRLIYECPIAAFVLQHATFSYPTSSLPKISPSNCLRSYSFQDFQPMWSWFINVTDRQKDRRHAIARPRLALWCIAR